MTKYKHLQLRKSSESELKCSIWGTMVEMPKPEDAAIKKWYDDFEEIAEIRSAHWPDIELFVMKYYGFTSYENFNTALRIGIDVLVDNICITVPERFDSKGEWVESSLGEKPFAKLVKNDTKITNTKESEENYKVYASGVIKKHPALLSLNDEQVDGLIELMQPFIQQIQDDGQDISSLKERLADRDKIVAVYKECFYDIDTIFNGSEYSEEEKKLQINKILDKIVLKR